MAKRKGSRMSRLERSQNAHVRLKRKWGNKPGKGADIKHEYHREVYAEQEYFGKILPIEDRISIYNTIANRFK